MPAEGEDSKESHCFVDVFLRGFLLFFYINIKLFFLLESGRNVNPLGNRELRVMFLLEHESRVLLLFLSG